MSQRQKKKEIKRTNRFGPVSSKKFLDPPGAMNFSVVRKHRSPCKFSNLLIVVPLTRREVGHGEES